MKRITRIPLILALAIAAASLIPGSSSAGKGRTAPPAALQSTASGGPTEQRWWGAAAGKLCRIGSGLGFNNPFGVYCVIALLDVITS